MSPSECSPRGSTDVVYMDELATILGISPDGARKALREGRLCRYGKVGRRVFVWRAALRAFLDSLQIDPKRSKRERPSDSARPATSGGGR